MLQVKNILIRRLLFLGLCIPLRTTAVILAKKNYYLKLLGLFYLIIGIGIGYVYMTDSRLTGAEVFGGKIWWHNSRIIFSIIWITFALLALTKRKNLAWKVLSADVIYGLLLFLHHHLNIKND